MHASTYLAHDLRLSTLVPYSILNYTTISSMHMFTTVWFYHNFEQTIYGTALALCAVHTPISIALQCRNNGESVRARDGKLFE